MEALSLLLSDIAVVCRDRQSASKYQSGLAPVPSPVVGVYSSLSHLNLDYELQLD